MKGAIYGGKLGQVIVKDISELESANPRYIFEGTFSIEPPDRNNISLIVGVPRPQTVKKIIQLAVSYGISEVNFIRMEKTIPSYCDSKVWESESLESEIWESLEQVGDSIAPKIILNKASNYFARASFSDDTIKYNSIFAYDGNWANDFTSDKSPIILSDKKTTVIILGPEAGFSEREREWIVNNKQIQKVGLGKRIFRLEHAVAFALSINSIATNAIKSD